MQHLVNVASPVGFLLTYLETRRAPRHDERGASAVEWVIIAALVVGIAIGVGTILFDQLTSEANDIGNKINSAGN